MSFSYFLYANRIRTSRVVYKSDLSRSTSCIYKSNILSVRSNIIICIEHTDRLQIVCPIRVSVDTFCCGFIAVQPLIWLCVNAGLTPNYDETNCKRLIR